MRIKIAFRNIFRNQVRTLLSILMIAGAVAAIILFHGFSDYILARLQKNTIDNRFNHIQVGTQAYWDLSPGNRKAQLITDSDRLSEKVSSIPGVTMVSGRMSFYGLLSTGEETISAQGVGYDPGRETQFQKTLLMVGGRTLGAGAKNEVMVGAGLQKRLSIKLGQDVTALAYTLDGVVNAVDLNVVGIFQVGVAEVDAHVFMLPVATVQTLLDTTSVENLTIRLADSSEMDRILPEVERSAQSINTSYHAKSWYELADLYRQTESFFKTQNRVIEIILISLILSGILNTVGMTVYERTGEIGTIRALGETRKSVLTQFTLEGAILGVFGILAGFALGTGISYLMAGLQLKMVLPGASYAIPILIKRAPLIYFEAAVVGLLSSTLATWLPAIRASRIPVVEALKKNI